MSITDELRDFANEWDWLDYKADESARRLRAIADRIDAEHEAQLNDAFETRNSDENLESDGWVRLPKDADGEHIHMGDRMENGELVARIVLTDGSWEPTVYTAATPNQLHEYYCHDIRHYHAPTVEDVLRQVIACANNGTHVHGALDTEQIVSEYAAKLRLAEGEDA